MPRGASRKFALSQSATQPAPLLSTACEQHSRTFKVVVHCRYRRQELGGSTLYQPELNKPEFSGWRRLRGGAATSQLPIRFMNSAALTRR